MPAHPRRLEFNLPLQGLRGFLALEIVLFHIYEMGVKKDLYRETHYDFVDRFGPYAVYLFFCISGFLITQSLSEKHSVVEFLKIRAIRIYALFLPLHVFVFLVGPVIGYSWLAALRGHGIQWLSLFTQNLLLLPGIFNVPIAQQNAWSLSYEALFYLFIAAIYASFAWCRIRRRTLLALWSIPVAAICWWRPLCLFIVVGVVVLKAFERKYKPAFPGATALAIAAFVAGPLLIPVSLWATLACAAFFFAVVVYGKNVVGAFLSVRPFQWLGERSYSLYLIHPFILEAVRRASLKIAAHGRPVAAGILFLVIGTACAVAVSSWSYRLIEVRLTNWLKRKAIKRKSAVLQTQLVAAIVAPETVPLVATEPPGR